MAHDEQEYIDGWLIYSNWIDDLRDNSEVISVYDEYEQYREKFMSLNTNLKRFTHLWNDKDLRSYVESKFEEDLAICEQRKRPPKSEEDSKRYRELGNKSFKDKNYAVALDYYTQAVRFAPYTSEEIALAFANRSAASYQLTKYRLCLLDIELAIKYGYPKSNMFKLLVRKVKCLHVLSIWTNDIEDIKYQLRALHNNPETSESIKTEINNMFEFIEKTNPETLEKDDSDVREEPLMKVSNPSKTLQSAGDCVEMSWSPEGGRHLITNKDVMFGRLLVGEKPYVCNLAASKRDMYCYNCFGRLHNCGLACRDCTQVLYCSEDCLNIKADVHNYECNKFLNFQDYLGITYLVAHLMFKTGCVLDKIPVHTKKTVDYKTVDQVIDIKQVDWPDHVYKSDYASVLALQDHADDYDYDSMMGYGLTAVYLLIALRRLYAEEIPNLNDEEKQKLIGAVLLRHLLQVQTNAISILDQDLQGLVTVGPNLSAIKETPIGVGIYPTIALLNHSCQPNVLSLFHRNKFVIRAARSLECGSEINYCYGPSIKRDTRVDRRRLLEDQYFFTCACDCCKNGIEDETRALMCPECQGPVMYNRDRSSFCLKCEKRDHIDANRYLSILSSLRLDFEGCKDINCDYKRKIERLEKLEEELKKTVYWRHPILVEVKAEMLQAAEEANNMDDTLMYCQEEIDMSVATYGKDSYETIMVQMKLVNCRWQQLYESVEGKRISRDQGIVELKQLIDTVSETRTKLRELIASTNIISAELSFQTELKFLAKVYNNAMRYVASLESANTVQPSTSGPNK